MLAALFLSAFGFSAASHAACSNRTVAVGDHGDATVTFTDSGHTVNIHTAAFGNFAAGPVQASFNVNACTPGLQPTELRSAPTPASLRRSIRSCSAAGSTTLRRIRAARM
jgi:hypothetical protein